MQRKIRFGIMGTNFISDRFCEAIEMDDIAEVVAICSREQASAETFASKYGIKLAFPSPEAFFACKEMDAVYIALPNSLHASFTKQALLSGKHVLCEKPMATSLKELEEMRACAKKEGKVLLEAMRPYFDPATAVISSCLSKVGALRYARLEFSQYSSRYDRFKKGEVLRAFDPSFGNAALMDIGIYPVSVAAMLFGAPNSVKGTSLFLQNGFEGLGTATLAYENMLVDIVYSKITQGMVPSVFVGEAGTLSVDSMTAPAEIIFTSRDGKTEKMPCTPHQNNMVYEIKAFCEAIYKGIPEHPTMAFTEIAMRIVQTLLDANQITFSN